MNIVEYSKSLDPLKDREQALFKLLDDLDQDSFELFGKISSLDINSPHDIEKLIIKTKELIQTFHETTEAFNYLYGIEAQSYFYIFGRIGLKSGFALATSTSFIYLNYNQHVYSLLVSVLSIIFYLMIQIRANKKFYAELNKTYNKTLEFDEEKLKRIQDTLNNCIRLLNGKIKNTNKSELENEIVYANYYLSLFKNNMITYDEILALPTSIKNIMTTILKQRLNKNDNDLGSLLDAFYTKHVLKLQNKKRI